MLNLLKLCKEEKDMSTSNQNTIIDVLIIGAGISGISAAYHLKNIDRIQHSLC